MMSVCRALLPSLQQWKGIPCCRVPLCICAEEGLEGEAAEAECSALAVGQTLTTRESLGFLMLPVVDGNCG